MNRIRELRKERGWRQTNLAAEMNTTPQSIGRYETGERGLDQETIGKLCDIFGCTADYLLCRSEVPSSEISAEEWKLIEAFRRLSPAGKEFILHGIALAELGHSEKNGDISEVEIREA